MVCRAFPVLHHSEFPACCKSVKVPPCHVIEGIMASSRRRLLCVRSGALSLLFYCVYSHLQLVLSEEAENCQNLRLGQYPSARVYRALTPHYRGYGAANVSHSFSVTFRSKRYIWTFWGVPWLNAGFTSHRKAVCVHRFGT